jgi:hypothetical protein
LYQHITERCYGGPRIQKLGKVACLLRRPIFSRDPEPGEYCVALEIMFKMPGASTWYVRRYPQGDRKKLFGGVRRAWISG